METSEKRKERLRAMRLEAEASQDDTSAPVPGYLSNPLADDNVAQEESCAPSRFGFYTDPMAGFSTDTKRSQVGDHIAPNSFTRSYTGALSMPPPAGRPMNPERPRPPHQFQSNYSPGQNMYQQNFVPQGNPTGKVRPFEMHHGNPPEPWNGVEGSASYNFSFYPSRESRHHGPRFRPPGSPGYRPPGIPGFNPPINSGFRPPGNSGFGPPGSPDFGPPGVPGLRPPESPGYRPPSPGYRQSNLGYGPPSPGYRPPESPSNIQQGRGNWVSHSPSPHSGRGVYHSSSSGRGRGYPGSGGRCRGYPGSGGRGGRGRGSEGYPVSPEQLYNASMVEDPWKGLSPVTWQALPPVLQKYRNTPFSGNKNKAGTSESSNQSNPQPNMAEYLAASLNETIKEESTEANQKKGGIN